MMLGFMKCYMPQSSPGIKMCSSCKLSVNVGALLKTLHILLWEKSLLPFGVVCLVCSHHIPIYIYISYLCILLDIISQLNVECCQERYSMLNVSELTNSLLIGFQA